MSDIIDEIDALVDESMAGGEPRTGYSYGDPTFPTCPHCNRHWHGLKITERIAAMYAYGEYDEAYSAADDDTAVLCEGSEFIGPMPNASYGHAYGTVILGGRRPLWPEMYAAANAYGDPAAVDHGGRPVPPSWIEELINTTIDWLGEALLGMPNLSATCHTWLPGDPASEPAAITDGQPYILGRDVFLGAPAPYWYTGDSDGDPYGPLPIDGERVTFIGPNGETYTDIAHVTGTPGGEMTVTTGGAPIPDGTITTGDHGADPVTRGLDTMRRMNDAVAMTITGRHHENRLLPMLLSDV